MIDHAELDGLSLAQIDAELEEHLAETADAPAQPPPIWIDHGENGLDQASRLRALMGGENGRARIAAPVPAHQEEGAAAHAAPVRPATKIAARDAFVVTIASGKGGVGKTSIAVNLAIALSAQRLRVSLLDADLGTANADVLCGLNPVARLEHVLTDLPVHDGARRSLLDIAIDAPGGFRLVPGAAGIARLADLSEQQRAHLLDGLGDLARGSDVIILDAAAGVGGLVTSLLNAADLGIVVVTPEPTSIADAYALIKCARAAAGEEPWRPPSLLINQVIDGAEARAVHARLAAVCDRFLGFRPACLGHVAQDLRVAEAVRLRRPLLMTAPSCPASRKIREAALRVAQQVGEQRCACSSRSGRRGLAALFQRWRRTKPVPAKASGG